MGFIEKSCNSFSNTILVVIKWVECLVHRTFEQGSNHVGRIGYFVDPKIFTLGQGLGALGFSKIIS